MVQPLPFREVLEVIEQLSADEQEDLVGILHHRVAEQGRKRLLKEIAQARSELAAGGARPATAGDLLREILA